MNRTRWLSRVGSAMLACAGLSCGGCASSRPARFFVLPMPQETAAVEKVNLSDTEYRVGILPIKLAAYIDRPQIVTRVFEEEVRVDEFNRWGAPLADGIADAMCMAMFTKVPNTYIDVYPWPGNIDFDYQVSVSVRQFDGVPGGSASLIAQWTVIRGRNADNIVARRIGRYEEPVRDKSCAALLRSMSSLIAMLSDDISKVLRADMDAGGAAAK